MVAIAVLFAQGVFEHYFGMIIYGMDEATVLAVIEGRQPDLHGLRWKLEGMIWSGNIGLTLLWIAAALTLITGVDYFRKAQPLLKEDR
jgi:cardiolipin synthase (CMP-forming)